jgi:hypothetical protein
MRFKKQIQKEIEELKEVLTILTKKVEMVLKNPYHRKYLSYNCVKEYLDCFHAICDLEEQLDDAM